MSVDDPGVVMVANRVLFRWLSAVALALLTIGLSPAAAGATAAPGRGHASPDPSASSRFIQADDPPADTDGDGITDDVDQCPNDPGVPENSGCPYQGPADTDGDGITDDVDQCPNDPGVPENYGCPYLGPVDSDGDGVTDDVDQCPATPGSAVYQGCPAPDSDGDGLTDDVDACPTLPGPYDGCPLTDLDNDGVTDDIDQCPDVAGSPNYGGCPAPDADADGVPDDSDGCPGTPTGENVDYAGCSQTQLDNDNDGVNNERDQCASTPADAAVDENGCAASERDTDGDGVFDDGDACVSEAGPAANHGCPLTVVTPAAVRFQDRCGTANDKFTVPTTRGVTYRYQGKTVAAGTHVAHGSVTVTARAKAGFALAGAARWSTKMSTRPCPVGTLRIVSSTPGTVRVTNQEASTMWIAVGKVTKAIAAHASATIKVAGGQQHWYARWAGELRSTSGQIRVR